MQKLVDSLRWHKSHYDDRAEGVFIPFELVAGELRLNAFVFVPCSKGHFSSVMAALKQEMENG